MLKVGLTGGIGAGKSTVARRLAERGAVVVDADRIAREVVEPGSDGLAAVVEAFGDGVLTPDGALDRPALGRIVFGDDAARLRLNGILHPRIGLRTHELMAAAPADAVVVHDVPLLVENRMGSAYHLVLVVHAPAVERVRRLVDERGMAEDDARARVAAQADDDARRAAADVWLDNSGAPAAVLDAVDRLWADRLVPFEANVRRGRPAPWRAGDEVPSDSDRSAQASRLAERLRAALGDRAADVVHEGPTSARGPAPDVLALRVALRAGDVTGDVRAAVGAAGFAPADDDASTEERAAGERVHRSCDPGRPARVRLVPAGPGL